MSARRTTQPRRSEYIKVNTDPKTKEQLQIIADERGWSLSLLSHEILKAWLEDKSLAWQERTNAKEIVRTFEGMLHEYGGWPGNV